MRILYIFIFTSISLNVSGQDWHKTRNQFIAANISISGIVGGTGALVNKRPNEKALKVFLKGFSQGCLGGTFQVLGKGLTYNIGARENLSYAWVARITSAVGNSITHNAANNLNFWEEWHFNLGVVRLDYRIKGNSFRARLLPSSFSGLISLGRQGRFNLSKSLQTGIMIFESDTNISAIGQQALAGAHATPIAISSKVTGRDYYELMAHETMHIIQFDNMVYLNPYFRKLDRKWKDNIGLYGNLSKYVYMDLNGITLLGAYITQINEPWPCRAIEREADFYSVWRTWPRCR